MQFNAEIQERDPLRSQLAALTADYEKANGKVKTLDIRKSLDPVRELTITTSERRSQLARERGTKKSAAQKKPPKKSTKATTYGRNYLNKKKMLNEAWA